ncbi:MAG: DUF1439 domain-containing protein [Aquabacterium sp.]
MPSSTSTRFIWRRRALLATVATAGLLAACASLLGPRTVEISREELTEKLGKQFPITKRIMAMLDVTAAPPRLDLIEDSNRIGMTFDLAAKELWSERAYNGTVGLSFGLRYEPSDLTIRLKDVRIEQVHIDGMPPQFQRTLNNVGGQLVQDQLQDYPIHHFKPEDLRSADRMGYQVGDIKVMKNSVGIQLVPRP